MCCKEGGGEVAKSLLGWVGRTVGVMSWELVAAGVVQVLAPQLLSLTGLGKHLCPCYLNALVHEMGSQPPLLHEAAGRSRRAHTHTHRSLLLGEAWCLAFIMMAFTNTWYLGRQPGPLPRTPPSLFTHFLCSRSAPWEPELQKFHLRQGCWTHK